MICSCGIRLRQWLDNTYYCPRCREIQTTTEKGERKVIKGEEALRVVVALVKLLKEMLKESIPASSPSPPPHPTEEVLMVPHPPETTFLAEIEGVKRETFSAANTLKNRTPCLLCGNPVENRCGAVCGSCGWVKPCDLA